METKMKITKILGALLLSYIFSSNLFAATVKSATTPLSGTYNYVDSKSCTADIASGLPGNYSSTYTSYSVGQRTYTYDTSASGASAAAALSSWISAKALPALTGVINATQDPTAANGVKLVETPLEWGTFLQKQTKFDLASPYASLPIANINALTHNFILVSFSYATPLNMGNIKTGYAAYTLYPGNSHWERYDVSFNTNSTTKLVTTATHIGANTQQATYNNLVGTPTLYNFDCVQSGIDSQ